MKRFTLRRNELIFLWNGQKVIAQNNNSYVCRCIYSRNTWFEQQPFDLKNFIYKNNIITHTYFNIK